jgi:hypothetical protein
MRVSQGVGPRKTFEKIAPDCLVIRVALQGRRIACNKRAQTAEAGRKYG